MRILLAEDDVVTRRFITVMLRNLGHEVIATVDGEQALAQLLINPPPVVISDWLMPRLDGVELCKRVRGLGLDSYTFFILLSVKSARSDYLEAMAAGVDDFLDKSVSIEELGIRLRVAERVVGQREESDRRIRTLARFSADNPNPVLQVDREGRLIYANRASRPLLVEWKCEVPGPVPEQLRELVEAKANGGARPELELACADRNFSFSAMPVFVADVVYLYGHDITDRKRAENAIAQLKQQAEETALTDQLTGLPNRRLFTERLKEETARAGQQPWKLGLLILDIDNFKQINDGYGQTVGDQMIVSVARHLRETLRSIDTVCRWGGDQLAILLTEMRDRAEIETICHQLKAAIQQAVSGEGIGAPISLSIGSAVFPDDADDATLLLQQADHALYAAKHDGRDCWRPFTGFPRGHDAKGQATVFIRLNAAVSAGQITAFYQPLISPRNGRVIGAEALARWHDDELGWVAPDVFIPLAEEKGLIFQLGRQVMIQALDQLVEWRRKGHEITVSVNLSRRQVMDPDFRDQLRSLVTERKLRPEWVVLEITERQSIIDQDLGRERIGALAEAGFRLSIDDFGSGYSSFDTVAESAFSELKISMGLIRQSNTPRGHRVVQAIIEMSRTLGLATVAEGVEDDVTASKLAALGVNKLQGYVFSKPLEAAAFLTYIDVRNGRAASEQPAA